MGERQRERVLIAACYTKSILVGDNESLSILIALFTSMSAGYFAVDLLAYVYVTFIYIHNWLLCKRKFILSKSIK
jgi:hypothetical protein